jgi:hypothetical protein
MAGPDDEIERFMDEGNQLAASGQHAEALQRFGAAWQALPDPKEEHDLAIGILGAIADMCFFLRRWQDCQDAVQHAFRCGADVSNPFFRLRLGQSLFELGNVQESTQWLVPVYLAEGRGPFAGEDPKYLDSFHAALRAPPGGWPEGW